MKKLLLFSAFLIFITGFSQGEQLYPDGVAADQDGNEFEWINYGNQDWAIENAEVLSYRDGTLIPEVINAADWSNLTTGAWTNNEGHRLYNWYAIMGIHDNDPNTPNKEFAPEGWHVPNINEWSILEEFLIGNGYNYDGSSYSCSPCPQDNNKISKALSSQSGWFNSQVTGAPSNDQSLNNSSGFNAIPSGHRTLEGNFNSDPSDPLARLWSSSEYEPDPVPFAWQRDLYNHTPYLGIGYYAKTYGCSVRFVRNSSTASINDFSKDLFLIYPNPTKEYLNIDCLSLESVSICNILGKELIKDNSNRINVSSLSNGVYFLKLSDGVNSSTKKFIKN